MVLEAGQKLSHYSLIEKIGEGGMGVVWKARDTKLDRDVAIKVLPDELAADAVRLARFEREAKAVAALNHPNIITVYSVEKDDRGPHFFTMELVNGKPLSRRIPRDGLRLDRFFDLAIPLADAISAAHERGITHRDLKPANVMVTEENRVKVLDFGLAKLLRDTGSEGSEAPTRTISLTRDGQLMGTVPYMSPEQLEGRAVDHRSDIFSLGVILHEMATGRHPFPGETYATVMSAILRDSPAPVTDHKPELPADLGRIIHHCLQKNPERRYQTAKGLRNELEELRKAGEIDAHTLRARAATYPRGKGRSRRIAVAAIIVGIAAAAAATFWLRTPSVSDRAVKRIVVLPFENLGPPEEAYFAGGMTDEITSRLAVVSGLRVISRTSAMRYAGTTKTLQQIGDELDVSYVLEGTVRWNREAQGRGRVRISPQLIRVTDDSHVWADVYERKLEDVFAVQSEIAERVARELGIALLDPEHETITARPTENMDAYNAYLRGLSISWPMSTSDELDVAAGLFERATRLDPGFAAAYSDLARIHCYWRQADLPGADEELAAHAIGEALRLAPHSPDVQRNAGWYYYFCQRDYPRAIDAFGKAIEARPSDSVAYLGLGAVLRGRGRFEEAVRAYRTAIELDPRYAEHYRDIAGTLTNMRRYAEAEEYYRQAIDLAPEELGYYVLRARNYVRWDGDTDRAAAVLEAWPGEPLHEYWAPIEMLNRNWPGALSHLSAIHEKTPGTYVSECACRLRLGQRDSARAACETARRLLEDELRDRSDAAPLHSLLGLTYALLGRTADAVREGRRAVELRPLSDHVNNNTTFLVDLAEIYATVGDDDAAIEQLDQLLSIPSPISVPLLRSDPVWDPLRDNPKFSRLLDKDAP